MYANLDPLRCLDLHWFNDNMPYAYLFTNEVLHHVFEEIDHRGKDIFAIAASFDYVFSSSLNGAANIDTLDMFQFQYWIGNLKTSALMLPYEEHLSFMAKPHERYGLKSHG